MKGIIRKLLCAAVVAAVMSVGVSAADSGESMSLADAYTASKVAEYNIDAKAPYTVSESGVGAEVDTRTGGLRVTVALFEYQTSPYLSMKAALSYETSRARIEDAYISSKTENINRSLSKSELTRSSAGVGWSFELPYVEKSEVKNAYYVHLRSGAVYEADLEYDNESGLSGYTMSDVRFVKIRTSISDPDEERVYKLEYKDGGTDYFDSDGLLIETCDRYGNSVSYEWESVGTFDRLKRISDSAGHEISITYGTESATVTSGAEEYELHYSSAGTGYIGIGLLDSVRDGEGNEVRIHYEETQLKYTFASTRSEHNIRYFPIKSIEYPTGYEVNYSYVKGVRRLNSTGHIEYLKVAERKEFDKEGRIYEISSYAYGNEPDGYPKYKSEELPEEYTYYTEISDRLGRVWVCEYNSRHLPSIRSASAENGKKCKSEFKYDKESGYPSGEMLITYDSDGDIGILFREYRYDKNGNLLYENEYSENESEEAVRNRGVRYAYDERYSQNIRTEYMSDGKTTVKELCVMTSDGKNIGRRCVLVNGKNQREQKYEYDERGRVAAVESGDRRTEYRYGEKNMPSEIRVGGSGKEYLSEKYEYDENDRVLEHIDRNGGSTSYRYDRIGRVLSEEYADGSVVSYEYDTENNVLTEYLPEGSVKLYDYTSAGALESVYEQTLKSELARQEYDGYMRLKRSIDGEGNYVEYEYEADGRVSRLGVYGNDGGLLLCSSVYYDDVYGDGSLVRSVDTNADGSERVESEYEYDAYGRLTRKRVYSGVEMRETVNEYDYAGNVIKTISASGRETVYTYDGLGNVLTIESGGITEECEYNEYGELTSARNGEGESVYYEYDVYGRKSAEKRPYAAGEYSQSEYVYDANGNCIKLIDASGRTTETVYDSMNRPVTVTNAGSETFYVYDLEGRITVMGNGSAGEYHENRYEYDILGRMTEKTDGEGQSECYEYDNTGKIIKKVDRNGKIWYYEYDGMGRMVSEKGEKDSEGNRYEYDIRSNKIKVRDITGKLEEEYGYNGYGELISEKRGDSETAYEYAPDGELVKLTLYEGGAETFSEYYGYDERARLIYANTPAGSEYYTYDRSDRLISAVNDKAGSEYRYEYGEDGNIAGIYYSVKGVWEGEIQYEYDRAGRRIGEVSINGRRGIKEKKYSYDGAGRLIREKDGGEVTEYTYDAYGNTDGIYRYGEGVELDRRVYTYDKNNRVETAYEGGVYTAYEYDGNGNMISRTRAGERESYEYDGRNRMISARVGMNTAEYEYNSAGIRVAKTVNGERTEYALSGNNVIAEENAQNRNEYYRGKGLIGYSDGKGTYVYRKNGHGDISGVYDMYGILVQEYEYDAYGNEAADYGMYRYGGYAEAVVKESDTNPYRYAGEYYDIETGFMYLRARYYDPSDCRFVSEDPICDGVNWYVYCAGDPVNFIDPNGLKPHNFISLMLHLGDATYNYWFNKITFRDQSDQTHSTIFAEFFLMITPDENGLYHASVRCWQKWVGYNDLYDHVFDKSTEMERGKFIFDYNDEEYVLWMWKGDYLNLGAGAEAGMYKRVFDAYETLSANKWSKKCRKLLNIKEDDIAHYRTPEGFHLPMTLNLTLKGSEIGDYTPTEEQWWITLFNPEYKLVEPTDMVATYTFDFSSMVSMYKAMKERYDSERVRRKRKGTPYNFELIFEDNNMVKCIF